MFHHLLEVIEISTYCTGARVWFAEGELQFFVLQAADGSISLVEPSAVNPSDPSADVNWGFVELSYTPDEQLFTNISYVDFVGLPLGQVVTDSTGAQQSAGGLGATAVNDICNDLAAQISSDDQQWSDLCAKFTSGDCLRALSPTDYVSDAGQTGAFSSYWTSYVDQVYTNFQTNTLTIDT